jgi:L-asparaginase
MNEEKNIRILLTGGTIGSVVDSMEHTICATKDSPIRLIQKYVDKFGVNNSFLVEQPYQILSENTNLETWNELCRQIWSKIKENYKGIIIAHGTDTCSYTAAMLGMMFDDILTVPLVVVSSNYAIGEPQSNGLDNFRNAVCFIEQESGREKGVFTMYSNKDGVMQVNRGRELTEADTCIDQFGVYGGEVYGIMENERFKRNLKHTDHCQSLMPVEKRREFLSKTTLFTKEVLMIKNYPGLNYDCICPESAENVSAVLQYLYHSATACVRDDSRNNSFPAFAHRCRQQGLNVYAAGFKRNLDNEYITMKAYEESDIHKMYDCSPEAAYANALILENSL